MRKRLERVRPETLQATDLAITPRHACGGPWHPSPHPRQAAFLLSDHRELLFGGEAGGGKSAALLMGALQYVDVPNYAALILRKTHPQLTLPGGLKDVSEQWLGGKADLNETLLEWTFPSGATITLSHVNRDAERLKFQSSAFQYVAFDEGTHWRTTRVYRYLFSRLRKPSNVADFPACPTCGMTLDQVPLRMRMATNPGGPGHTPVKERFIDPHRAWQKGEAPKPERPFIRSRLTDNPSLDEESYRANLADLEPIERARLEEGNWDIKEGGGFLKTPWFPVVTYDPPDDVTWCRNIDLAATTEEEGDDPDYTAGALVGLQRTMTEEKDPVSGRKRERLDWWIADMLRGRWDPADTDARLIACIVADVLRLGRRRYRVGIEQEPGSGGKRSAIDLKAAIIDALGAIAVDVVPSTGSKLDRARPLATAANAGRVKLIGGEWVAAFYDEIVDFSGDGSGHDDQVDAVTGAMEILSPAGKRKVQFL